MYVCVIELGCLSVVVFVVVIVVVYVLLLLASLMRSLLLLTYWYLHVVIVIVVVVVVITAVIVVVNMLLLLLLWLTTIYDIKWERERERKKERKRENGFLLWAKWCMNEKLSCCVRKTFLLYESYFGFVLRFEKRILHQVENVALIAML